MNIPIIMTPILHNTYDGILFVALKICMVSLERDTEMRWIKREGQKPKMNCQRTIVGIVSLLMVDDPL